MTAKVINWQIYLMIPFHIIATRSGTVCLTYIYIRYSLHFNNNMCVKLGGAPESTFWNHLERRSDTYL